MPYCMGTLFWQLNDVWPVSSWSSIEYSGKWKALHYAAKKFYRSVAPLIYIEDGKLYVKVANDGREAVSDTLIVNIVDFSGNVLRTEKMDLCVASLTVQEGIGLDLDKLDRTGSFVCASFGSAEASLLLCRPKDARIGNPGLSVVSVDKTGYGFDVKISCEKPAFYVVPDAGSIRGKFTDSYFTLNGERVINFFSKGDVTAEEFAASLRVYDLYSSCEV